MFLVLRLPAMIGLLVAEASARRSVVVIGAKGTLIQERQFAGFYLFGWSCLRWRQQRGCLGRSIRCKS